MEEQWKLVMNILFTTVGAIGATISIFLIIKAQAKTNAILILIVSVAFLVAGIIGLS